MERQVDLSPTQQRILQALCASPGLTNPQLAERLNMKRNQVRKTLEDLFDKLPIDPGDGSRFRAALWYQTKYLTETNELSRDEIRDHLHLISSTTERMKQELENLRAELSSRNSVEGGTPSDAHDEVTQRSLGDGVLRVGTGLLCMVGEPHEERQMDPTAIVVSIGTGGDEGIRAIERPYLSEIPDSTATVSLDWRPIVLPSEDMRLAWHGPDVDPLFWGIAKRFVVNSFLKELHDSTKRALSARVAWIDPVTGVFHLNSQTYDVYLRLHYARLRLWQDALTDWIVLVEAPSIRKIGIELRPWVVAEYVEMWCRGELTEDTSVVEIDQMDRTAILILVWSLIARDEAHTRKTLDFEPFRDIIAPSLALAHSHDD